MQQTGLISGTALTGMQQSFIHHLVYEGVTGTQAARLAGYRQPKEAAYSLTRNPKISSFLRQERQKFYQVELATLAGSTLKQVMKDPDAPAAARVSAARSALELAGDLGRKDGADMNGRSLAELTPDELGGLIDRWEGERAAIAKDVTPQAVDPGTAAAASA